MMIVIALGSCGWQAHDHLDAALAALPAVVEVMGTSRRFLNPPWGDTTRLPFLNQCIVVRCPWPPSSLLRACHAVERAHGRVRHPLLPRNGARALDMDVIAAQPGPGQWSWLPHPQAHTRSFVVIPMIEALQSASLPVPSTWMAARQALILPVLQPQAR
jgi:2-amino-4-hydroxy-6-hydroxymethyldihydropteridine diphosphokinase